MPLYFGYVVLIVNKYHDWVEILHFFRINPSLGKHDDLVAWLEVPRRRAVEAHFAGSARTGDRIGLPEYTIGQVRDVNVLKCTDAAGGE